MDRKLIYFLCTGNSCRSQMAEGWAKKYLGDDWEVRSAGIEAHGLNPNAVKAMKEVGIDISNQTSDIIDPEILNHADLVVTLCGDAADKCPMTPPHVKREHWGFDDPAKAEGTDEEKWAFFQRVRDEIGERIKRFATKAEIFDPAMCCSTGVCGPSVDPELTRVASAIYSLEKKGFDIKRYQLTNDPDKFAENKEVNRILHEKGPDALPIILVNDQVVKVGSYPTNQEFAEWFNVKPQELNDKRKVRLPIDLNL